MHLAQLRTWLNVKFLDAELPCRTERGKRVGLPAAPAQGLRPDKPVAHLSNSFSPGRGALEHAMDALAGFFGDVRHVLFVPYAASDPDGYTAAMRGILGRLGVQVSGAHRAADPLSALARADGVFVGGGNAFRLLQAVQRSGLLTAMGSRVREGMPYLGVSAGCPATGPRWAVPPAAGYSPAGMPRATSGPALTSPHSSAPAPATIHRHASTAGPGAGRAGWVRYLMRPTAPVFRAGSGPAGGCRQHPQRVRVP